LFLITNKTKSDVTEIYKHLEGQLQYPKHGARKVVFLNIKIKRRISKIKKYNTRKCGWL